MTATGSGSGLPALRRSAGLLRAGACGSHCRQGRAAIGMTCCSTRTGRAVMPHEGAGRVHDRINDGKDFAWAEPDMAVLRLHRRRPPSLPIMVFGPEWCRWIENAAAAAACPADYVAGPLLASVSALIGNARWAQATPGWAEPPHLWVGSVGDSGAGKSPGADCLMRNVLPRIEAHMAGPFPDQLREWRAAAELQSAKDEAWRAEVRSAAKAGKPPP